MEEDLSRPGRLTAAIDIYRANLGLILPKDWPTVTVPVLGNGARATSRWRRAR